jgi:hypothetical protein
MGRSVAKRQPYRGEQLAGDCGVADPAAGTATQRDRHGSKFVLRFHQGRRLLIESTVPHCGHATSVSRPRRARSIDTFRGTL